MQSFIAIRTLGEKLCSKEAKSRNHHFHKIACQIASGDAKSTFEKHFRCADAHCGCLHQFLAKQAPFVWKRITHAGTEASRTSRNKCMAKRLSNNDFSGSFCQILMILETILENGFVLHHAKFHCNPYTW